ncbi:MAG: endonuclease MutS2 [Acidobacteriota bacterium]
MEKELKEYSLRVLEYDELKMLLASYALTPIGMKRIGQLEPIFEKSLIQEELNRVTEAVHFHHREGAFPISNAKDPEEIIKKLKIEDTILNGLEVYSLLSILKAGVQVRKLIPKLGKLSYYLLSRFFSTLPELQSIVKEIDGNVTEKGNIESSASKELYQIRKKIAKLKERIKERLDEMMFKPGADRIIQDEYITIRSGRYVIPVRTDAPFPVKGIIHGTSSTGHTIFVEPISTVDMNNEIIKLTEEETVEIEKILKRYTYLFRTHLDEIKITEQIIAEVDLLNARAKFAIDYRCTSPDIDSGGVLRLVDARHPLLEKFLLGSRGTIVPISAELGARERAMIISGPNAGGKTVALKTIGLLVLMAQSGMHVPAEEMQLPIFKQVLADIGDQQSISASLSTFSAHIDTVSKMAKAVTDSSLILIDEIGTGTDPAEGTALALSIIEYFKRKGALIAVTTHHGGLKIYGYKTEGVLNAAVEFDEKTFKPTYRLIMGAAGASSGINVARQLGLDDEIVEGAKRYIGEAAAEAEDYLTKLRSLTVSVEKKKYELEERIKELEADRKKLDADFKKKEAETKEKFNKELSALIAQFRSEADMLLGDLKEKRDQLKLDRERMKKEKLLREKIESAFVKKKFEEMKPLSLGSIKAGSRVLIQSLGLEAVVESVRPDGMLEVSVGKRILKVGMNDCAVVGEALLEENRVKKPPESVSVRIAEKAISREINVIGKRVEEALDEIDKYLDDAFLAGHRELRVIHGIGKGRLKQAIHEMLKDHPHVSSYRTGAPQEGGDGATIITLKD